MGGGSAFSDINNPKPVVRVGDTNSQGVVEITDIIFTTRGPGKAFSTELSGDKADLYIS